MNVDKRPNLLLIEDSATQVIAYTDFFEAAAWTVSSVRTAEDGLVEIEKNMPDVVIVDNVLPGMNGDEFCRQMRMNVKTRAIPTLLFTSDETEEREWVSLKSGADDFVRKSEPMEILELRARHLLSRVAPTLSLPQTENRPEGFRCLLVDDSPSCLLFMETYLESVGFEVDTAEDGMKALAKVGEEDYDAVIIDYQMPNMDGIEVCRRIRKFEPRSQSGVVIIILTGSDTKEVLTRAMEAGADDLIVKSAEPEAVEGRVRAQIRRKNVADENQHLATVFKEKELAVIRADSERKLAQVKLEAAEEITRMKSDFVATVAHELRTPIAGVRGAAENMAAGFLGDTTKDQREALSIVIRSTDRLTRLVNSLLDLAMIEAGVMNYDFQTVKVNALLSSATSSLQVVASEQKRVLNINPADPDVLINADQDAFEQILTNLIGNALKFSEKEVTVRADANGDHVVIAVEDDGPGIPDDEINKVFDRFHKIGIYAKKAGAGLGLAITKGLVEAHSGKIWAENCAEANGGGARFVVQLPTR